MASIKFNPFTGKFDYVGSGGGASYIDGEVEFHADLPVTVGTPAVDSAFLVRKGSGFYFLTRKPAGIWVRELNNGNLADWVYAGTFADLFRDANFRIINDADTSKEMALDVSEVTTATTRTLRAPDRDGRIALSDYRIVTASGNLVRGDVVAADTTAGAFTLTLPATPSDGDTVAILDYAGTFDTNNLTIARNGSNIESLAEDMDCNIEDAAFSLVFVGSTVGWKVVPYFGSVTDLTGYATTAQLTDTQIFTANGTWTKPAGAKQIYVELVGGGGGGGGGRRGATSTARGGGGGGAGAGRTALWLHADQLGATETVTVAAGGAAGAAAGDNENGGAGAAGGNTSFGPLNAFGGNGGNGGNASAVATGGAAAANRGFVLTLVAATIAGGNGGFEGSAAAVGLGHGAGGGTQPAGGGGGSRITAANVLSTSGGGGGLGAGSGGINPYTIAPTAAPAEGQKGISGSRLGFIAGGASGGRQGSSGEGAEGGDSILGAGGGGGAGATNGAGGSNAGGLGGNGIVVITTYF